LAVSVTTPFIFKPFKPFIKMPTIRQHEVFNKKVHNLLTSLGAKETGKCGYKYSLDTKAGVLLITTHEPEKSDIFSVYCRFDEPDKAKVILSKWEQDRLNPYSGKWNYHQRDADYLLGGLEINLTDIKL